MKIAIEAFYPGDLFLNFLQLHTLVIWAQDSVHVDACMITQSQEYFGFPI